MEIAFIAALVIAIPLILFPVTLVWYFNIGGIMSAARATTKTRVTQKAPGAVGK